MLHYDWKGMRNVKTKRLIFFSMLASLSAFGQGVVNFCNLNPAGLNSPVYEMDGKTKLSGSDFFAELRAGPAANALSTVARTPMLTGEAAGYFQGGVVYLSTVAAGDPAFLQVAILRDLPPGWIGIDWPSLWAVSPVFSVATGGGGRPPSLPASLLGLTPIILGAEVDPPLGLYQSASNTIVLSWDRIYPLFGVEQSATLVPPNWTVATNVSVVVGGQYQVILARPEGMMFYRLVQQR